jgi:hypothetical protein
MARQHCTAFPRRAQQIHAISLFSHSSPEATTPLLGAPLTMSSYVDEAVRCSRSGCSRCLPRPHQCTHAIVVVVMSRVKQIALQRAKEMQTHAPLLISKMARCNMVFVQLMVGTSACAGYSPLLRRHGQQHTWRQPRERTWWPDKNFVDPASCRSSRSTVLIVRRMCTKNFCTTLGGRT